jgi:ketosteroid isomerase-like protein
MSQENVEIIRHGYEDWAATGELQTPTDLVWDVSHLMASLRGTGKDSGAEVRTPTFALIWTVRDGQAVRVQARPTRAAALEVVGLDSEG